MTSAELLALNPGYNINKLQIGEVLTLSASVPYLTMTVVKQERYRGRYVPTTLSTPTAPTSIKGDYKVTSKGEYGTADVVAKVTYVNGEETERTVLSSVTLQEPVTEYRLRGTKERPTWLPTGTFRWPTSGRITSYFGGRSSPGGIGSTNHKGIDIANSRRHAHLRRGRRHGDLRRLDERLRLSGADQPRQRLCHLLWPQLQSRWSSVGQHVYKGQQIARTGSTGNSTGNHCHFEVRYNGVAKNPLNYLP